MSDAAYGVRSSGVNGRYSTALPANEAAAASWDPDAAYEYGKLIGTRTARAGLQHDPRRRRGHHPRTAQRAHLRVPRRRPDPGRNAGGPAHSGHPVRSTSSATSSTTPSTTRRAGATRVNVIIGKRAARETDLLAFEIGVEQGPSRRGDVLLQPREWRLRLRKQLAADRGAEEGLEVPRLCAL